MGNIMTGGHNFNRRSKEASLGIAERKEREKAERKTLIIRCAKDLILERGAEEVSMGDIAKKAELSKATLYLYFSSKDVLFMEICSAAGLQFIKYFRSRLGPQLSALESLKLFWNCYLDIYGKSDDMIILFNMKHYLTPDYPFISLDSLDKNGDFASSYELFDMIRGMIREGIAEGSFEPDINPTIISHTVISLFSLIVENTARSPGKKRRSNMLIISEMRNIFQILLRGIAREHISRSLLVLEKVELKKEKVHAEIF
jgi:AcrR family transcriptional regulator